MEGVGGEAVQENSESMWPEQTRTLEKPSRVRHPQTETNAGA
jgi:hypothetical protein